VHPHAQDSPVGESLVVLSPITLYSSFVWDESFPLLLYHSVVDSCPSTPLSDQVKSRRHFHLGLLDSNNFVDCIFLSHWSLCSRRQSCVGPPSRTIPSDPFYSVDVYRPLTSSAVLPSLLADFPHPDAATVSSVCRISFLRGGRREAKKLLDPTHNSGPNTIPVTPMFPCACDSSRWLPMYCSLRTTERSFFLRRGLSVKRGESQILCQEVKRSPPTPPKLSYM